jgi:tetratricopeptide (TPR) repeat protein
MLQQASATTPSNSVVTALLSRVYVEMGNYEAAVALWRDHRLAEPISNLVFRLYTDEKIDVNQARWMAEQAVLADSSSPTAWAEFGWTTYLQTHDADSAITALNRAVELDPDNWYPLLRLVQVYNAERAPEQALPYAQELVRRWPNLENAHYAMAETLQALGELEKAETELVRALELGPAPYVQERLADLYFQTGRLDQAISLWEAVLPQSPVYWRVHLKLARAYLSQGKPDLARAHVLLVKRDHIDDAQVQELMREIGE